MVVYPYPINKKLIIKETVKYKRVTFLYNRFQEWA